MSAPTSHWCGRSGLHSAHPSTLALSGQCDGWRSTVPGAPDPIASAPTRIKVDYAQALAWRDSLNEAIAGRYGNFPITVEIPAAGGVADTREDGNG